MADWGDIEHGDTITVSRRRTFLDPPAEPGEKLLWVIRTVKVKDVEHDSRGFFELTLESGHTIRRGDVWTLDRIEK